MKVKIYFKTLDDLWTRLYTPAMIKVLQTLNYYQLIGSVDFSFAIYSNAKMLDIEEINIHDLVERFLISLQIPDLFDEMEAAYLQSSTEYFESTHTFP